MRLSIWQQFSSNHSGAFGVIGLFKSADEAGKAADELKQIFRAISAWYDADHPWTGSPTEPEQAFAQHYGIEWAVPVDWLWKDQRVIDSAVENFEQVVTIKNPSQTWMEKILFETLLKKLGAETTAGWDFQSIEWGEKPMWPKVYVTCRAAEEKTVVELQHSVSSRQTSAVCHVKHTDDQLQLEIEHAYPADLQHLIGELTRCGCTDIHYQFEITAY